MAASIMSKKIAAGANGIVLDVKYGRGALMGSVSEARELARLMVDIGKGVGRRVTALLSNMSQPLGKAVGNALEVREAIATLEGAGPEDFTEHCTVVAGHMLRLAGVAKADDLSDVREAIAAKLRNGEALAKLRLLVELQGGDVSQIDDPERLPAAPVTREVRAERDGWVYDLDALEVGTCSLELGGGRKRKGDPIDPAVGVVFERKIGDRASRGEVLCVVHAADTSSAERAERRLQGAYGWSERPGPPLFADVLLG
jgi:pyrimidine-nucleoside phosphorylase